MKLVFVYDGGSGSAATVLQTIKDLNVFDSVIGLSSGKSTTLKNITDEGAEKDTLVFLHALDTSENLKQVVLDLLSQSYAVCYNLTGTSQSQNLFYQLGVVKSVYEPNVESSGFETVGNSFLINSSATQAGRKVATRSESGSAIICELQLEGIASDYVQIGFTTTSSMSSFGFLPHGSTIGTSKIEGVLINVGAIFFNSTKPAGSDLANVLKDLAQFCVHKGLSKTYKIAGTVSNSKQEFLSRKIRAYNKKSGTLLAETMSSEVGSYSLELRTADPVYVVCIHDDSDTNNSQIQDDILPILIE